MWCVFVEAPIVAFDLDGIFVWWSYVVYPN